MISTSLTNGPAPKVAFLPVSQSLRARHRISCRKHRGFSALLRMQPPGKRNLWEIQVYSSFRRSADCTSRAIWFMTRHNGVGQEVLE